LDDHLGKRITKKHLSLVSDTIDATIDHLEAKNHESPRKSMEAASERGGLVGS
jgi:hypothetical protein